MSSYTYEHPRPALTADVVVFARAEDGDRVLLIRRGQEPFQGKWALPGGFVSEGERLEHAARRELAEETGLDLDTPFVQVGTFGDPGRDPRGWTVSAVYSALLPQTLPVCGGDDAAEADWHRIDEVRDLAFDHDLVLRSARERVCMQ